MGTAHVTKENALLESINHLKELINKRVISKDVVNENESCMVKSVKNNYRNIK